MSAVANVLQEAGIEQAEVSLAVVDDTTIHELNRRHLQHDYATDVLSFVYERAADTLEGEIVVSADTAAAAAPRCGWSFADELLLYVIHGALHLAGHDDQSPAACAAMRRAEAGHLARFGLTPHEPAGSGPSRGEAERADAERTP